MFNLKKFGDMYYIIKNELDEKIVGKKYPQVDCLTMSQAHLITAWKLFDPKPKLQFRLKNKAILTNVLSDATISSTGFLIDKFTLDIFKSFNLMRYQVFEAQLECNKKYLEYFWLHLSDPELTKKLDYQKTQFFRTEFTFREEPIALSSYDEYERLKSQDKNASFGVEIDQIALSNEFDNDLDLFTFLPFDNKLYVSDQLRNELQHKGVIGFEFQEATNFLK